MPSVHPGVAGPVIYLMGDGGLFRKGPVLRQKSASLRQRVGRKVPSAVMVLHRHTMGRTARSTKGAVYLNVADIGLIDDISFLGQVMSRAPQEVPAPWRPNTVKRDVRATRCQTIL